VLSFLEFTPRFGNVGAFLHTSDRTIEMDAAMRLKDEPSEFGVFFSGRAEAMEGLPLACLNPRCSSGTEKRNESGIC
jgi:hypothetical protein